MPTPTGRGLAVTVVFGPELKAIASALRTVDDGLPAKLRADLMRDAKPLVNRAKAAARAIPVRAGDEKNLRRIIARGIKVQAGTTRRPRVRIVTSMPDVAQAIIPRGLDAPKGFRHPVFGTGTWVVQTAMQPNHWFFDAMKDGQKEVSESITKTIKEALEFIAAHGIKI